MSSTAPQVTSDALRQLVLQIEDKYNELDLIYSELSQIVSEFYEEYNATSNDTLHCDGFLNKSRTHYLKLKADCEAYVDYIRKYAKEITPDNSCKILKDQKITW